MGMDENIASEMSGAMRMLSGMNQSEARTEDELAEREKLIEQQIALDEQGVRAKASDVLRKGDKEAAKVREQGERGMGTLRAQASRSGVSMSGSRALVDSARAAEAREVEQDVRDEAHNQANAMLTDGGRRSDMRRIGAGMKPKGTAIALGAKLYGNRR